MKQLFVLAIAGSLLAASANAQMPQMVGYRSLTVTGEATTKISPDQAIVPVTVLTEEKTLNDAKKKNDEKVKSLLSIAKKYGVADADMKTSYTNVQPLYDYQPDGKKPKLRGYQAQASIQFKLSPIDKAAGFMEDVVNTGIDRIDGIQYTLKDDQKVREETTLKALANATQKAKAMAGVMNVTLGKPLQISESGNMIAPPPMPYMARAMMAKGGAEMDASAPNLPSGIMEVQQNVSVSFEIQ